jgi:hypothetical protein
MLDVASEGTTTEICAGDVMDIEEVGATAHPKCTNAKSGGCYEELDGCECYT